MIRVKKHTTKPGVDRQRAMPRIEPLIGKRTKPSIGLSHGAAGIDFESFGGGPMLVEPMKLKIAYVNMRRTKLRTDCRAFYGRSSLLDGISKHYRCDNIMISYIN